MESWKNLTRDSLPQLSKIEFIKSFAEGLMPPPPLTVSGWADKHRVLSREASASPGRWETSRAEYQRGMMDVFSDPSIHTIIIMSSAQVGKTELLLNALGYFIDYDPCPILFIQPTGDMAEGFSKERVSPMVRDTPRLKERVSEIKGRDSSNTIGQKLFPGGVLTIIGSNSPSKLASRPIRVVLMDEVDRYPFSSGSEGDPVSLAIKRTTTFWNRKVMLTSTPTVKGSSRIERAFDGSDKRYFYVPCPDCGEEQKLKWSNVQWDKGEPETARYVCDVCGSIWSDVQRWAAIKKGHWVAEGNSTGVAGFHLWEAYSPWVKLESIVRNFIEAKPDPQALKAWVNTSLGETWEDKGQRATDEAVLLARREDFGAPSAPAEVAIITCGIDVQDDRLEVVKVGWGKDEEAWDLDHVIFWGDPSAPEVWRALNDYLSSPTDHELLGEMRVHAACLDTGGHYTQKAYLFCRDKFYRNVWAIKGIGGEGKPIWPRKASKNNKQKVMLFSVGVDACKETIYARLNIEDPGPGYFHFSEQREGDYFKQLTAEEMVTKYEKGQQKRSWQVRAGYKRNEVLDCWVYAYAALQGLYINRRVNVNREAKAILKKFPDAEDRIAKRKKPVQEVKDKKEENPTPAEKPKIKKKNKKRRRVSSRFV